MVYWVHQNNLFWTHTVLHAKKNFALNMVDIYWIIVKLLTWIFSHTLKQRDVCMLSYMNSRSTCSHNFSAAWATFGRKATYREKKSFHVRFPFWPGLDKSGKSNEKIGWSARDHVTAWRDMVFYLLRCEIPCPFCPFLFVNRILLLNWKGCKLGVGSCNQ